MLGLIGKKIGMTQYFDEDGQAIPVTAVEVKPCTVVQVRTDDRDGYEALQLGYGERHENRIGKAQRGHRGGAGRTNFRGLKEFRVANAAEYAVGQDLKLEELFAAGDRVDVTGTSKGRGFAGVMKRHNFAGHRATHGTHESFRGPGAIGACAYPGRVFKGKRMPGRMGGQQTTTQNLSVVAVRPDDNVVLIRGAVPGANNGDVVLRPAVKQGRVGA